ncbi:MAG: HIT family protein [bacterium]
MKELKILYAPWRGEYLMNYNNQKSNKCIFCYYNDIEIKNVVPSFENLVLYKSIYSFIMLNKYPYINGHLMVIPYSHVDDIELLTKEERDDIFELLILSKKILKITYNMDGYNIGSNVGKAAGAGIENHVHFHILPRFIGDHNFMTTISDVRVISFSLEKTYNDLLNNLKKII